MCSPHDGIHPSIAYCAIFPVEKNYLIRFLRNSISLGRATCAASLFNAQRKIPYSGMDEGKEFCLAFRPYFVSSHPSDRSEVATKAIFPGHIHRLRHQEATFFKKIVVAPWRYS